MNQLASAALLLATWERVYGFSPARRSVALFSLARPDSAMSELVGLSVGERDRALLDLREGLFGPRLNCVVACPACSDKSELGFTIDEIRVPIADGTLSPSMTIEVDQLQLTIRSLTCADLLAVEAEPTFLQRESLMRRCLSDGDRLAPLSAPAQKLLVEKLAEADPQADIRIGVTCGQCGHGWSAFFDIASHLWAEIDAWAKRLITEVHALASAYGWAERDIVAMSPWRRQLYMGMLRR